MLTQGTAGLVHFLETGGTGARVCLVVWETEVTAAAIIRATAITST